MTPDQSRFVTFHKVHFVERWQWLFQGSTLRATAGTSSITISVLGLGELVDAGVVEIYSGACAGVRLTQQGRAVA